MRALSFFTFLVASGIPVTSASFDPSRALNAAKGIANTRQLEDFFGNIDLTDTDSVCWLAEIFSTSPELDAFCNEDKTEVTFVVLPDPTEYCDEAGEFCQKDSSQKVIIPLPIQENFTETDVIFDLCTTYTKGTPEEDFVDFINKNACITAEVTTDAGAFFGLSSYYEPERDLTACSASVGDETCSCTVCGENKLEIACPTLAVKSECVDLPIDEEVEVIPFAKYNITDDGSESSPPSIAPSQNTLCDLFTMNLQTDLYGEDISWMLEINTRGNYWDLLARNSGPFSGETFYEKDLCIPKNKCFKFTIHDAANDGLCCNHSMGSYSIFLKEQLVKYSIYSNSAKTEETVFGTSGEMC